MTISNYKNLLKQLRQKQPKLKKFLKNNKPKDRVFGRGAKSCVRCGSHRGFIEKYGLNLCRRCFRDTAPQIGWKKYS